jgi:hypothetical protein
MKRIIILIALAFCCLVIWLVWPTDQIQPSKKSDRNIVSGSNQISTLPATVSRREQLKNLIETNDNRINFFGVVTDTEGKPLEEVQVSWDIVKSGSFAPSLGLPTGSRGTARTDTNGRFAILNESGTTIGIKALNYSGYHNIDNAPRSFGYGNAEPHKPDILNPIRFVMAKDGGQRSKKVNIPLKFDWDGLPKEFEIGPKGFSDKIILIPTREPLKSNERDYNWKLVVKAKDAQLILGNNEAAPLAPESGYADSIVLQTDVEGQRGNAADALIYLKTNAGKYAELRISAYSDRGSESGITGMIDVRWNPDGGRAFE